MAPEVEESAYVSYRRLIDLTSQPDALRALQKQITTDPRIGIATGAYLLGFIHGKLGPAERGVDL